MSVLGKSASAWKVTTLCIAALLFTSTTVTPRPVQAGVTPVIVDTDLESLILYLLGLLGRDNGSDRHRHNLLAIPVPLEAVGTDEAQKDVQCMINALNRVIWKNPQGSLVANKRGRLSKRLKRTRNPTVSKRPKWTSYNQLPTVRLKQP